jgi:hypothetical protein
MAKDGKTLEALVHAIESSISGAPNVRVEAKKRLPDKDTGQLREHDVVLTFSLAHHEFLLALECRDRSRPIGVPDVEAFHAKCLRTGIGRGVMVSSKGFRRTALRKAESYGIGCLKLEEVARFDWGLTPAAVVVVSYSVLGGNLKVDFERDDWPGGDLYCEDGSPLNWPTLRTWAIRFFNESVRGENVEGNVTRTFVDNAPTLYTLAPDGSKVAVTRVTNTIQYDIKRTLVPLEFRNYIDAAQGKLLTSAATAQLNLQQLPVTVVVNKLEDGSLKATFVPTTDERYKGWSMRIEGIEKEGSHGSPAQDPKKGLC